jgi:hypothetical protein
VVPSYFKLNNSRRGVESPPTGLRRSCRLLPASWLLLHYCEGLCRKRKKLSLLSLAVYFGKSTSLTCTCTCHSTCQATSHQPLMDPYTYISYIWLSPHDHLLSHAFEWENNSGWQWKLDGSISWDSDWLLADYFAPIHLSWPPMSNVPSPLSRNLGRW